MKRIVLLALALAGCGGGSVKIEDYGDAYHEAYCKYLTKCGDFASVDACLDANIGFNVHLPASEIAAEEAGKFDFDGGKAKACIDKIADASCDRTSEDVRAPDDDCFGIVHGNGDTGDACVDDAECASGSCTVPACGETCCQGTCDAGTAPTGLVGEGASCEGDVECEAGLYCDIDTNVCTTLKASGTTCSGDYQCDYGLACIFSTTGNSTCGALPDTGGDCSTTQECAQVGDSCVNGTCTPFAVEGDACSDTQPCSPYYHCDTGGHCASGVAAGGACTETADCADYAAYCDDPTGTGTGTCVDPQPNGATCDASEMCQSAYCDVDTMQCADQPICI